jgi:hypothetical protein
VCYAAALLPIVFLGIGSTAPGIIAGAIQRIKDQGTADAQESMTARICRHEAAHFCCGYWCGLPIASFETSTQQPRVEFALPADSNYSATEVAALAVTGLAGLVGEALEYGTAKGASQDLMQVERIFRRAQEFYGSAAQQDVTRWAAFTAAQLLCGSNKEKYERVVAGFERKASMEVCIGILES